MTETPTRARDATAVSMRTRKARADLYELEADAIKALAHPKRLMIVDLLSDGSERNVTDLQQETRLSQSNLSQNLAVLRSAGIVSPRRDGNVIYYHITDPRVLKAVVLLRGVMEAKLEDQRFLAERNAAKAKDRAKNATILSLTLGAGLLAAVFLGAASMPLFMGGDLGDVADHASMMISDPTIGTFMQTCRDVLTEQPAVAPADVGTAAA